MAHDITHANVNGPAHSRSRRVAARILGERRFKAVKSMYRMARLNWRAPVALRQKTHAWRHGFLAESYLLYNLDHNDPAQYINHMDWKYRCSKITESLAYYRHKLAFRSILLRAGVAQPETVALIAHGRILLNPLSRDSQYASFAEFEKLLLAGDRYVVKPEDGNCGEGIFLLAIEDGRILRQRGLERTLFERSHLPTVALVERMVRQGDFWQTLFPGSANTIRILTGRLPNEQKPLIIRAAQRIGTIDTVPTDNWSGGALSALIDVPTGRLGPARSDVLKSRHKGRQFSSHPDSGAPVEGAVIPNWEVILDAVFRACACSPLHHYVGWDVVVDQQGTPIMLEGNGNSGVHLLQVHGGLLTDPAVRRFYHYYGIP